MDWNFIGKLWFGMIVILTLGTLLVGCGNQRWTPTDPMQNELDTSNMTIEATWELDIHADITP